MSGRVTEPPDPNELPSMRERNPGMWWVAVIIAAAMIITTATGLVSALLA